MIAIDWGSTALRAYRLDDGGAILDRRRAALGILACEGRYVEVLRRQIHGWDDTLIVLAGMIGSREGWVEAPYVQCPATPADIAAGMIRMDAAALPERQIWMVPGLRCQGSAPHTAEVMRGEETQLCGLMRRIDATRQFACLPGTHSKWVRIEQGRVDSFVTAMTGELFELLCRHGLIGRLMADDGGLLDRAAAAQGATRALEPGGVLQQLFSVRTGALTGALQPTQLRSYLSGLLIAHELLDLPWAGEIRDRADRRVHLIGGRALLESYELILRQMRVSVLAHEETLGAHGMHVLAQCRALLESTGP